MKHTPGPWKVFPTQFQIDIASDRSPICRINGNMTASTEDEANAYLIASAPELLQACEYALENLKPQGDIKKDFSGHLAIAELSKAVHKAKPE